jgi:four helix bundle protein
MEKSGDVRRRAFNFALDVVMFCRKLPLTDSVVRRLAFQLIDAASSIGANLEEAADAQTKPDFIAKNFISLKEARESRYWLQLIAASTSRVSPLARPLIAEVTEIRAMLVAGIKRARSNPSRGPSQTG